MIAMSRWQFLSSILLPVVLASVFTAGAAQAQPADTRSDVDLVQLAASEYALGRAAYESARTQEENAVAAEHFEKADLAAPDPVPLRMAIRARVDAGQFDRAATLAAAALVRYPTDKETVALANQTITKARPELHKLTVACDDPCSLLVGRRIVHGQEATETTVYVVPGRHDIIAGWSHGRSQRQRVEATRGGSSGIAFAAPEIPTSDLNEAENNSAVGAAADDDSEDSSNSVKAPSGFHPAVFFSAVGVTAVLAGVTVWSNADMRANPGKDKVREDCVGLGESCPTYQDGISAQKRTNTLLIVSGVAAVGTGVLGAFFTNWSGSGGSTSGEGKARVVPTVAVGQGLLLGASGSF